ncbi:MAG TPA: T9SS type A sorting domain-containing protein [Bacteroidia bacterium]|nr:T9SS type A sorting domain-containing protein [Bacteroidia bacterium]
MKKITIVLLIVSSMQFSFAQYGQKAYRIDNINFTNFQKGIISDKNNFNGQPFYVATGYGGLYAGSIFKPFFVKTLFSGYNVNKILYTIKKNGTDVPAYSNAIAEAPSKYVLAGNLKHPSPLFSHGRDILIIKTDKNGVPSTPVHHIALDTISDEAYCIINSKKNDTKFYTCGYTLSDSLGTVQNELYRPFIMKHNATGSVVNWVRYFKLPCYQGSQPNSSVAYSVVEDSATGNVCIAGSISGSCGGAFLAKFTQAGNLEWLYIYSALNSLSFFSIKPTEIPREYIITGACVTPAGGGYKNLLFRVNTSGTEPVTIFAKALGASNPDISQVFGYDVCTRVKGQVIEYYVSGRTDRYYPWGSEGHIYKCDASGDPVQYMRYKNDTAHKHKYIYLKSIDWIDSGPYQGLAGFGYYLKHHGPGTPLIGVGWLVKSYFNLVDGCNETEDSATVETMVLNKWEYIPDMYTNYTIDTCGVTWTNGMAEEFCWETTVAGGTNSTDELSAGLTGNSQIHFYPNPASGDIYFNLAHCNSKIHLTVINFLGQQVADKIIDTNEAGIYSMNVSLLKTGIYKVMLVNDSNISTGTFLKE